MTSGLDWLRNSICSTRIGEHLGQRPLARRERPAKSIRSSKSTPVSMASIRPTGEHMTQKPVINPTYILSEFATSYTPAEFKEGGSEQRSAGTKDWIFSTTQRARGFLAR